MSLPYLKVVAAPPTKAQTLEHYSGVLKQAKQHDDQLYRCHSCGYIGPSDVTYDIEVRDDMNDRPPTQVPVEIHRCFECRSDDIVEAIWCELCNERPATVEGTDMCQVCYEANEAEQDANVARAKEIEQELHRGSCDVCDKRPSVRSIVAYGIETSVCDECSAATP